jgi:class 3 adenylate cyclase/tetratricopeptide (TPR) repeat protein
MMLSRVLSPVQVGRDSELSTLEDALLSALRGDGGVVIVGGEAGMGKTRLVHSLAARARRLGCVVLSGGCSEAELSLPYLPFLEAIGNYLATMDVAGLTERLGSAAGELAQLFPQLGRRTDVSPDPSQAKLRLFESILILLADAARSRALLLVLEDLQWADASTRELLDYATRRLRSTNVLVVATYRSDEMHRKHALLPTIQGWRRNGQVEMVELKPLDSGDVGEMVQAIFDETSVSDEFRDFLVHRSEGNPFVIEETLRDALDRGDIFRTDEGWDRKSLAEMRIPPTVRDMILQRLERFSPEHVAILAAASVIGRSFDVQSLAAVAQVDEAAVVAALEASVLAQLIEEEDRRSGRFRFRHALTQEAIYEDLVVPRRRQLHSRVADVLLTRKDVAAVDLANHLFMAGRNQEAVAMSVAAADAAAEARAYHAAAELLERAAPYVEDEVERARMLCRAGTAYHDNAESVSARRLLEQSISELERAGFAAEAARYRMTLGRIWWELMRTDLAHEEFERVRKVLEPLGPSEALANLYIRISSLASFNEEHDLGIEFARKAIATADSVGAKLPSAWAPNFLGIAEVAKGQVVLGFQHLDESYRRSLEGGFQFQIGNAVYNAVWIAVHLAGGDELAKWLPRIDMASAVGFEPWPYYARGLTALAQGRIGEAIASAEVAEQRSREGGQKKMSWRAQVLLAHALAESMRVSEAIASLPPISTRVDFQDSIYDGPARVRTALATNPTEADAEAKKVTPSVCLFGSPADIVAEATRDTPWLSDFLARIAAQGEAIDSPRVAIARGRLALYQGDFVTARALLSESVQRLRSIGFLLDLWHGSAALAEAEHGVGDVEGATRRLRAVVAQAEEAGALLAARVARDTAARLGVDLGGALEASARPVASPRVAPGERMVSVLFADVRGYSRLAGQTAPAELLDKISALQRWATQEVERRRGVVDKFAGDAVMATFNVSGQSVDHTLQALRTAVAIIDKAALAGVPVGAGVAVGPAVVGNLAESANLSVLGDVTNLASRLQAAAGAGEVILAAEAYRRSKEWLEGQQIEAARVDLDLKGFEGPVPAYRVTTGTVAAVSF